MTMIKTYHVVADCPDTGKTVFLHIEADTFQEMSDRFNEFYPHLNFKGIIDVE